MAQQAHSACAVGRFHSKDQLLSVIIPVLDEAPTIQSVVNFALSSPCVGEVLVLDDGCIDGTPELAKAAGARVLTSSLLGKGGSMADGVELATHETLLYLDGDLTNLEPDLIARMAQPLFDGQT